MGVTLSAIENAIGAIGRLGASAPVVLGSLVLTGMEVPDQLRIGGRQMLVVHRLPGGGRVVDALGNDPGRLELRGRFFGPDAQARAQTIERMRVAGRAVAFSAAGLALTVWIVQFVYSYEAKGAVCSYELTLELAGGTHGSAGVGTLLSDILGGDLLGSFSGVVQGVSESALTVAGQVGAIAGQVMPLATLLGGGGAVSKVMDALGVVRSLGQAGSNLASVPGGLASVSSQLGVAGAGLMDVLGHVGSNLEGIQVVNSASLQAVAGNAALLSAAADAGGQVNRSLSYAGEAQGASRAGVAYRPAVHS